MGNPDDLIVPGQPNRRGGVRRVIDVPGAGAPTIKLGPDDLVVIGDEALRFLVPDTYIIVSLARWAQLLARATQRAQEQLEADSRQVRRQQRRAMAQDRQN